MSREQAIKLAKKFDGVKPPMEYISHFCKQINITEDFFWKIANKFRNKKIWKRDEKKQWYIKNWIGGDKKPDNLFTVFAGQDAEAVATARQHLLPYPPSSPSIGVFKDGELVHFVERLHIEGRTAEMISDHLKAVYKEFC